MNRASTVLERHGIANPEAEARRVDHILSLPAPGGVDGDAWSRARDLERVASLRATGTPLEYAIGFAPFLGRLFRADARALIPREETELLARTAIELAREMGDAPTILDVGTGSGNLAVTLAHEVPGARVVASDITAEAVELATTNAAEHGVQDRVSVRRGSLFEPFEGLDLEGRVDLVVCNPPYIPTASLEKLAPEIREHEPREAFDGGGFGVDVFRGLIDGSERFLRSGGGLAFEIGAGQDRLVRRFLERKAHLTDVRTHTDAEGTIRVFSARRA